MNISILLANFIQHLSVISFSVVFDLMEKRNAHRGGSTIVGG